jgi:excisionase family DNA binding protein
MAVRDTAAARALRTPPPPSLDAPEAVEDLAAAIAAEVVRQLAGPAVHDVAGALLNAEQAAALLSVPATWVLAEARANRVPHIRLGRYVRFEAKELERWWQERARGPTRGRK